MGPQFQIDAQVIARMIVQRIRDAARPELQETRLTETAALDARRDRVLFELKRINGELEQFEDKDREKIEDEVGAEFNIPHEFDLILRETGIRALGDAGGYWGKFYTAVGLK
jgi:hypothetical protein